MLSRAVLIARPTLSRSIRTTRVCRADVVKAEEKVVAQVAKTASEKAAKPPSAPVNNVTHDSVSTKSSTFSQRLASFCLGGLVAGGASYFFLIEELDTMHADIKGQVSAMNTDCLAKLNQMDARIAKMEKGK
jgi:hypothetical protein